MVNSPIVDTTWHPDKKLVVTRLCGRINEKDILYWENSLHIALKKIPDNETFKILVNTYGFEPVDLSAHKRYRSIIPVTLANFGWQVGYLHSLPGNDQSLQCVPTRGIQCIGAAHCHQDSAKMAFYEAHYSSENERFFSDPLAAEQWLGSLHL